MSDLQEAPPAASAWKLPEGGENKSTADDKTADTNDKWWKPNVRMIPNKLYYFTFFGAIGCLFPFLAIYFKQLGLTPTEIGLVSAVRPLVGFLSGPLWGALADKYKIRKIILWVATIAWICFYLGIGFLPPADRVTVCPQKSQMKTRELHSFFHEATRSDEALPAGVSRVKRGVHVHGPVEEMAWSYDADGLKVLFLSILALVICGELFQSPSSALADAATLHKLGQKGLNKYGHQRAWGAIGFGGCSFVVGALISRSRHTITLCGIRLVISDYRLPFYIFTVIMAFSFIAIFWLDDDDKPNGDGADVKGEDTSLKDLSPTANAAAPPGDGAGTHDTASVFKVFLSIHHCSWLMAAYFMGICNGVIWGFLFWHLENIGATQMMMGTASFVNTFSEFVMFFFMEALITRIGCMTLISLSLVSYLLRFMAYAFVTQPWWVLPAESLQGFTFAATWAALVSYSYQTVPACSLATIQGIIHGVYWGLGSGCGQLFGGILVDYYGAVNTFKGLGTACAVVFVLFGIAQRFSKKPETSAYNQFS